MNRWTRCRVGAAAGLALLAACGGGEAANVADKAGGDTVVLRLATFEGEVDASGQAYGPAAFVDGLEAVSDGRLKVELLTDYGEGVPDAESRLVAAIASGAIDGGWPSTRAFAEGGVPGLEAVEAPMVLTSYAAQKALVSGPLGERMLEQLDGTGVVGLGLAVGPLRRPFAAEAPLLAPEDWHGARFRAYNSPVQSDTIRALGGTPVELSFSWIDEILAGNLRGAEFDTFQYSANGLTTEAPNVTANVVLWPKMFVLAMSQKRFDALSDEQRGWVRQAATQAVQASVDATFDETTVARALCDEGVRFVEASPDQIAALQSAVAPVMDGLASDPVSGPLLADIEALAAQHLEPDTPNVPESCQLAASDGTDGLGAVPDEVSALPEGTYRVEITVPEVESAGYSNADGWSGTWTLVIDDGTYAMSCRPIDDPGRDCGTAVFDGALDAGYVHGTGSTVYFVYDAELHSQLSGCELPCFPLPTYRLTWALDGDTLRFSDLQGAKAFEKVIEPWTKIA
jgi:TRAP-type C4-dicarboxylate transport system substrate-binding protein